jgi:hypothetical protein
MNKEAHDYLIAELKFYQKAYEIQFTHFMGVFYFWSVVVTAPATAGLLTFSGDANYPAFPILLVLIALMGWFLSAKMFDIRCSQLKYISKMNYVRYTLYQDAKANLPESYKHPFPPDTDFRKTAFTDFGMIMAIVMSALDSTFLGFALPLLQGSGGYNWDTFTIYFLFGIATYFAIVLWRLPVQD